MISDFVTEWYYWLPLFALLALGSRLLGARMFDFQFLIVLVLAQYAVHSVIAFGAFSRIAVFCCLFLVVFVAFSLPMADRVPTPTRPRSIDRRWIQVARLYLLFYYSSRLLLYPYLSGELLLDAWLAAQRENQLLFTLGLAVQPALAACMYSWFTSKHGLSLLDKITMAVVVVGMLGSGSKAAVVPIVLVYFGVASYLGRSALKSWTALALIASAVGVTAYVLTTFFPDFSFSDIAYLIQYRLAANTDNLEYLLVIDQPPGLYPFSGIGALIPLITKRFGYEFEFAPGVWLYGSRYGDWSGFGPNSGIVMDYFGNMAWGGLAAAASLGWYVKTARQKINPIRCSFFSMAYIAVIDIGIFDVSLIIWGGLWMLLVLTRPVRLPAWRIRWGSRHDSYRPADPAQVGTALRGPEESLR